MQKKNQQSNLILILALIVAISASAWFVSRNVTMRDDLSGQVITRIDTLTDIQKNILSPTPHVFVPVPEVEDADVTDQGNSPLPGPGPSGVLVHLLVNGSHTPPAVNFGQQVTVSWTSTNATSCTPSGDHSVKVGGGIWDGPGMLSTSGVIALYARDENGYLPVLHINISCTNGTSTSNDTVSLPVNMITGGVSQVYLLGGETSIYSGTANDLNDVWTSSGPLTTWTNISPQSIGNDKWLYGQMCGQYFQNKFWVIETGSKVWSSPDGLTWTNVATIPSPVTVRSVYTCAVFNNTLFMMGGFNSNTSQILNDVWSTTDGMNWTQMTTPLWSSRTALASASYQGRLWIFGGFNSSGIFVHDVWNTTDGNTWNQVTGSAGWSGRAYHSVNVFNNKLWLMGGETAPGSVVHDVWSSTDGNTWNQVTGSAPWVARGEHRTVIYDNKLWLMGGISLNPFAERNDIWVTSNGTNWSQVTAAAPWIVRDSFGLVATPVVGGSQGTCNLGTMTTAANQITNHKATLNGCFKTNNNLLTTTWFSYGTNAALGTNTPTITEGYADAYTAWQLTNLAPNTTYYFRISSQNSAGISNGSILTFTTLP